MIRRSWKALAQPQPRGAHRTPVVFQRRHWQQTAAPKPAQTEQATQPATRNVPNPAPAAVGVKRSSGPSTTPMMPPAPTVPRAQSDAEAAASAAQLLQTVAAGTAGVSTAELLASMGLGPAPPTTEARAAAPQSADRAETLRRFHEAFGSLSSRPPVVSAPATKEEPPLPPAPSEARLAALSRFLGGGDVGFDDVDGGDAAVEAALDEVAGTLDQIMTRASAERGAAEGQRRSSGGRAVGSAGDPAAAADIRPETEKERKFLTALRDATQTLESSGVPCFITCGTALGARRERRFIAHDEDIDLGVFWDELVTGRPSSADGGGGGGDFAGPDDGADEATWEPAQQRVLNLLSAIGTASRLVCFDVLGEVHKGFQLRLKHLDTGVLVDLNVYYRAIDADGDGKPYVWCATHYAESAKRRHGMYRYRNSYPLEVPTVRFYDMDVRCPTERYLAEYFGDDWRVPKKFGYDEGLAGGYKNIIAE